MRPGALLALLLLAQCSAPPAQPGTLLGTRAFPGSPPDTTAQRFVYASTAPDGSPISVSAFAIFPGGPPPPDGRPVLAWLHPTTGVAPGCAPSQGPNPFGQIQGLERFLAAGYIVVATDYPGLGTPDPGTPTLHAPAVHPYLVGDSEARAALDSVRAVRRLDPSASARFGVWGHSQGGQAALFTASLARLYAPELELVGAAAAAPGTNQAALIGKRSDNPLWGGLLSYVVWSWSRLYGLDPGEILPSSAAPVVERTAQLCLQSGSELQRLQADSAPLNDVAVSPDASWRARLAANDPQPAPDGPPVFLAQGTVDPVIPAALTRAFALKLCQSHVPVRYLDMPGVDHYTAAVRSAGAAAAWLADRFAGRAPPDDCAALLP